MKKYDINRFYVGELHISLERNSPLIDACGGTVVTKEEVRLLDLIYGTMKNGAVDIKFYSASKDNYRYQHLYSLFYKDDNGKYYCLHNGITYDNIPNGSYCSDLIPFYDILPKYGFDKPSMLAPRLALKLFSSLFIKKNSLFVDNKYLLYNKDTFDLDRFFVGNIELCEGYLDLTNNQEYQLNIPYQLILFRQNLYEESGYYKKEDINGHRCEVNYSSFKSIFLKTDDHNFYNINNHRIYDSRLLGEPLNDIVHIDKPLVKEDLFRNEDSKITIPKVLIKQQNML